MSLLPTLKSRFGFTLPFPGITNQYLRTRPSTGHGIGTKLSGKQAYFVMFRDGTREVAAICTLEFTRYVGICAGESYFDGTLFAGEIIGNVFVVAACLVLKSGTGLRYAGPSVYCFATPNSARGAELIIDASPDTIVPLPDDLTFSKAANNIDYTKPALLFIDGNILSWNAKHTIIIRCRFTYNKDRDMPTTASFLLRDDILLTDHTLFYYGEPVKIIHIRTGHVIKMLAEKQTDAMVIFGVRCEDKKDKKDKKSMYLEAHGSTDGTATTLSEINELLEMTFDSVPPHKIDALIK